jgi:hypothetical protein
VHTFSPRSTDSARLNVLLVSSQVEAAARNALPRPNLVVIDTSDLLPDDVARLRKRLDVAFKGDAAGRARVVLVQVHP